MNLEEAKKVLEDIEDGGEDLQVEVNIYQACPHCKGTGIDKRETKFIHSITTDLSTGISGPSCESCDGDGRLDWLEYITGGKN